MKNHEKFCVEKGCKKKRNNKDVRCPKHGHAFRIKRDPVAYYYSVWRRNARRRGKEFGVTLEEYRKFAEENGLFDKEGRKRANRTIDRVQDEHGYFIWNIRVLTVSENSRKRYVDYWAARYESRDMSPEEIAYYERQREQLEQEILERQENESNEHSTDTDVPF